MNPMEKGLCDWVELYALNGLEDEAAALFELHLRDCAACRKELRELREVTELLPLAPEPVPVPVGMKRRVLERVLAADARPNPTAGSGTPVMERELDKEEPVERFGLPQRRERSLGTIGKADVSEDSRSKEDPESTRALQRSRPLWTRRRMNVAVLALVAAVGLLAYQNEQMGRKLADTQDRLNQLLASAGTAGQPMRDARPEQAVALSPAAANIVSRGLATIVVDNKGTHLIVQAEKLPELKGTQAFQVWLLKDGQPSNAGTFTTTNGSGAVSFTLADNRAYDTLAITLEPDAYGDKPRGEMILKASLTGNG